MAFWEDTLRYLYLPRLKSREVLAAVVRTGAASQDFFGTAYGQSDGKYEGFQLGEGAASLDDTLLLIEPEAARQYAVEQQKLIDLTQREAEEQARLDLDDPRRDGSHRSGEEAGCDRAGHAPEGEVVPRQRRGQRRRWPSRDSSHSRTR